VSESPSAALLSVGDEILLGQIADTNAAHIADQLWRRGWPVRQQRAVGDRLEDITAAVAELARGHRVLVLTGGLGPTADDLTRQALAAVAGVELVEDETALAQVRARFAAMGRPMSERNRVQGRMPAGAAVIENPVGTAPGIDLELDACRVFALPGVPGEMRRLLRDHVLPAVGPGPLGEVAVKELHLWGLGESAVGERLGDLMARGRQPEVGTRAQEGLITVRILAWSESREAAAALAAADEAVVRQRLADFLVAADGISLPQAVVDLLRREGLSLALAESCTGGLVGRRLTEVPGASEVLREGFIVYSNEAKRRRLAIPAELLEAHGAVSEPVARALAANVRRVAEADCGIGITGIAGPGGGTAEKPVGLVHVAVASPAGTVHRECRFALDREGNRVRAAMTALGLLWRLVRYGPERALP
jgi:nicotinamide-nucleotide amidase